MLTANHNIWHPCTINLGGVLIDMTKGHVRATYWLARLPPHVTWRNIRTAMFIFGCCIRKAHISGKRIPGTWPPWMACTPTCCLYGDSTFSKRRCQRKQFWRCQCSLYNWFRWQTPWFWARGTSGRLWHQWHKTSHGTSHGWHECDILLRRGCPRPLGENKWTWAPSLIAGILSKSWKGTFVSRHSLQ